MGFIANPLSGDLDIAADVFFQEDFISTAGAFSVWTAITSGSGNFLALDQDNEGRVTFDTNTGGGASAGLGISAAQFKLNSTKTTIELRCRMEDTPSSFDPDYRFIQLASSNSLSTTNDMITVGGATDGTGVLRTRAASTDTNDAFSTTISVNTWMTLKLEFTDTLVTAFLDGVEVASSTTNLPTGVALHLTSGVLVSAADGTMSVDWIKITRGRQI